MSVLTAACRFSPSMRRGVVDRHAARQNPLFPRLPPYESRQRNEWFHMNLPPVSVLTLLANPCQS